MIENIIRKVIKEMTSSRYSGYYNGPLSVGEVDWEESELGPFKTKVSKYLNSDLEYDSLLEPHRKNVKQKSKKINEWYDLNKIPLNEDLAVWFGKKKKPKGSSQPKGPWVDICRKVDGKHPPCGRSDTSKGSYPKCRAAGVAGKMSTSEKRAACQQKRRAEKQDTQTGKGQKPIMTSYKPKKKRTQNESLENLINKILRSI
jgi:hypothetical protein